MPSHENSAIQAVLTYIDAKLRENTTCAFRLGRLRKIHAKLPKRVRKVLHDFNVLSVRLQRVLQNPDNLRANVVAGNEPDMQRLFARGSGMLSQAYLDHIHYNPKSGSKRNRSGRPKNMNASQRDHGRQKPAKPASDLSEDERPSISDNTGVRDGVLPDRLIESIQSKEKLETVPVSKTQLRRKEDKAVEAAFQQINEQVKAVPLQVFVGQQGNKMAQLTTTPTPELEKVYRYAFGDNRWKPIAIELQSYNRLDAKKFLRCIVWSFLHKEIFYRGELREDLSDLSRLVPGAEFLTSAIDAAGAEGKFVLDNVLVRRAGDPVFHEKVVDPIANRLTHKLMLILGAHLPQQVNQHAIGRLRQSARAICQASLILLARMESFWRRFEVLWYSKGRSDFDERDSTRRIAFTVSPCLRTTFGRRGPGRVLCKAETQDIISWEV